MSIHDLNAQVDWGWGPDYVDAMRRMVALPAADDFIIASGASSSIKDFAEAAYKHAGLNWVDYVKQSSNAHTVVRPSLVGSFSKLNRATGWEPRVRMPEIAARMVDAQIHVLSATTF